MIHLFGKNGWIPRFIMTIFSLLYFYFIVHLCDLIPRHVVQACVWS